MKRAKFKGKIILKNRNRKKNLARFKSKILKEEIFNFNRKV